LSGHRIRRIDDYGDLQTIAGNRIAGQGGDGGAATAASLYVPAGIATAKDGSTYIADY
jgi:trimeric autotransporter adhesin